MAEVTETRRTADGQTLAAGDVVRTSEDPATLAEVVHRNGAVTRLDRLSEISVDRVEDDGRARIVVALGPGRTWHATGPLEDPTLYEVRCPSAVLTARFARFALDCHEDGTTLVTTVEGNVVVRGTVGGSVALSEGQTASVDGAGVVTGIADAHPDDHWVETNLAIDAGEQPPLAISTAPAAVDIAEDAPVQHRPAWVGRAAMGAAVAVFAAVLAFTFVTADNATPSKAGQTLPPGAAAAMIRATQDRNVAPDPPTTTVAETPPPVPANPEPGPAPPAPAAIEPPKATATGTSCRQSGRTIVYSGTVTNVSQATSSFAVETYFTNRAGARFDTATATVDDLAPGRTARWEVRVTAPGDLRNTGSCEIAGVRPLSPAGPPAAR